MMNGVYQFAIAPFQEFAFLRRALVATIGLGLSAAPLGVLLTLRRMSLFGEALSHAVLPGVAVGFVLFGLSLTAMSIGGFLAGIIVVATAGLISRYTELKEDASLAAIYLVALALGVMLISRRGTQLDLLHILFGSVLGVDAGGLLLMAGVASISLLALAALYRGQRQSRHPAAAIIPDAGGIEPGGGLPDAGHADGGWVDDAACGVGAALARYLAGATTQ